MGAAVLSASERNAPPPAVPPRRLEVVEDHRLVADGCAESDIGGTLVRLPVAEILQP
jgi:hypothetical protein